MNAQIAKEISTNNNRASLGKVLQQIKETAEFGNFFTIFSCLTENQSIELKRQLEDLGFHVRRRFAHTTSKEESLEIYWG